MADTFIADNCSGCNFWHCMKSWGNKSKLLIDFKWFYLTDFSTFTVPELSSSDF